MTDPIKALIAAAERVNEVWTGSKEELSFFHMQALREAVKAAKASAEARPEPEPDESLPDGYYRSDCYPYWFRLCRKTGSLVMWGFSVHEGEAGYRTLGCSLDYWRQMPMGHLRATIEPDRDRRCDRDLCRMLGRPDPAQCRPHCTTMVTDCDHCRPEPAAEPSVALPEWFRSTTTSVTNKHARACIGALADAVEALAREVRR